VFDFETTGLDVYRNEVVEMAAIKVNNGKVFETYEALIKIKGKFDPEAQRITGITDKEIEEKGIDPVKAWQGFGEFLEGYTPIIAHNGYKFDYLFMEVELNTLGLQRYLPDKKYLIDTALIYKAMKANMKMQYNESLTEFYQRVSDNWIKGLRYSLNICMEEFGIDCKDLVAHRALADVIMTHKLYESLLTAWN
jgi:DNA polymerase III epsilon subunit-like protein